MKKKNYVCISRLFAQTLSNIFNGKLKRVTRNTLKQNKKKIPKFFSNNGPNYLVKHLFTLNKLHIKF